MSCCRWNTLHQICTNKIGNNNICHNPNIEFATKCEVQGAKNVFTCEIHFHKWGRVQEMKPNDSQVRSHFGNCIRVEFQMFRGLAGKANEHQIGSLAHH
jgi:hypothetical protein